MEATTTDVNRPTDDDHGFSRLDADCVRAVASVLPVRAAHANPSSLDERNQSLVALSLTCRFARSSLCEKLVQMRARHEERKRVLEIFSW